jgi:hypothetical protein
VVQGHAGAETTAGANGRASVCFDGCFRSGTRSSDASRLARLYRGSSWQSDSPVRLQVAPADRCSRREQVSGVHPADLSREALAEYWRLRAGERLTGRGR